MDYIISMLSALAGGAKITLGLFFITLALSIPLGLVVALLRLSKIKLLAYLVGSYIWLMRGTPLLLQLIFVYYTLSDLPYFSITLSPFSSVVLAFTLNYAAYFAEIFRAGIQSIDRGQYEGAKVLGMNYLQTMRRIVLPQMAKRILPPISNETITLVKDTSLVYILAINDVLRVANSAVNRDGSTFPYLFAAIFYLTMTLILTWMFQRMEKYYARYDY